MLTVLTGQAEVLKMLQRITLIPMPRPVIVAVGELIPVIMPVPLIRLQVPTLVPGVGVLPDNRAVDVLTQMV